MKFFSSLLCGLSVMFATKVLLAEPVRILISVGHSQGTSSEKPLKHSSRDANRVRDLFLSVGGVTKSRAFVLSDPNTKAIDSAIDSAAELAKKERADDVTLIFYFSGHGDKEHLHLGSESIALPDLSAKLARIPAHLRVIVTDSCRTNELLRQKGVSTEAGFAVSLVPQNEGSGSVWLHASADGEAAQESDELEGAVFTHYWVSGLAGAADTNGDHRVTLSESFAYAYDQTLYRTAKSSGVLQRPTVSFDVREAGPLVLTETSKESTVLRLPKGKDRSYLVYALGSRTIAAEAWGSPDRVVELAVPHGRYIIQRRGEGATGAAELSLADGDKRDLVDSDFRSFNEETLAMKGGELIVHPNEITATYGIGTTRISDFNQTVGLGYAHSFDRWLVGGLVDGTLAHLETTTQSGDVWSLGGTALLERELTTGSPSVRVGLGPRAEYTHQHLVRLDESRLQLAGYTSDTTERGWLFGGSARALVSTPVGGPLWIGVEGLGSLLFGNVNGSLSPVWRVGTGVRMGAQF